LVVFLYYVSPSLESLLVGALSKFERGSLHFSQV